jgi:hypothetical protein
MGSLDSVEFAHWKEIVSEIEARRRKASMMNVTRRKFAKAVAIAPIALIGAVPAFAAGFLEGTWVVRCPRGHDDYVTDITRNHDCETCNTKAISDGAGRVVCPNGHASFVSGVTRQHKCPEQGCGLECRRE